MIKKIELMHKLFGELPDRKCKDCQHLSSYTASRKYYKCEIYGNTSSEASDWRLKYTACGMIDVSEYNGTPIIKLLNRKPEEQMEGQLVLDEFSGIDIPERAWTKEEQDGCLHVTVKMKGR